MTTLLCILVAGFALSALWIFFLLMMKSKSDYEIQLGQVFARKWYERLACRMYFRCVIQRR